MVRVLLAASVALALALTGACANSSVPPSTGRDGEPGGRDGGGRDAGVGSDGGPDAGPAETCTPGTEDVCTTVCGTTGRRTCGSTGTFGPCGPPEEDCNGVDDDCDGSVDEDVSSRACSSECGGGTETCESGSWSGCTATMPRDEVCDGTDNDCDSLVDEGLTRGCSTGCGSGTEMCVTGAWLGCTAPRPTTETCNGIDDDCDGTVDDGLSRPCSTACGTGTETCAAGLWGACSAPPAPAETCNAADDDCNGRCDDLGACRRAVHRGHSGTAGHVYSTDLAFVTSIGLEAESFFWVYAADPGGFTRLYRCTKPGGRWFLTRNSACEGAGSIVETLGWVAGSEICGSIPLHRLYADGNHFYTTSAAERDSAVSTYGYAYEGIEGYVFGASSG